MADEISVLRKGKLIATVLREEADRDRLVQLMVGEESLHVVCRASRRHLGKILLA